MLHGIVHPADIQDRDGGGLVLSTLFGRFPFLTKLFADGSLNAAWVGSDDAEGWRKISRSSIGQPWHSFAWPQFG